MSVPNERSSLLQHKKGNFYDRESIHNRHHLNDQPPSGEHGASINETGSVVIQNNDEPGLPIPRAVFVVTNAALGAGMLAFPEAYAKTGGVPEALGVQAVLIALIIGAFLILGFCGQVRRTANYQDTVLVFCGPIAQVICQVIVVVYMFGSDVTYLILIGDQLTKVIDHSGWYFDRRFIIAVVSCICILPLCIPKKLKVISYSSLFGGIGAFFVCLVVMSRFYTGNYTYGSSSKPFFWPNVFAAVPVICFGFQCHVTSVAVLAELHNPTLKRFGIVTALSTLICTVIYSVTGSYGFLTFGHNVKSDILLNYDPKDGAVTAARAVIVMVVFSTYAICHFVGRSAFLGLWTKLRRFTTAEVEAWQNKRRIITSLIWFFSSLGLSIIVPNIGKAIAIVGGFAAHFIFTFPGLCLIQIVLSNKVTLSSRLKNAGMVIGVLYVVIGFFLFAQTVTQAIMDDINNK
ncbi:putative sodium-coupled neutral amino acid transporter 7 [Dendronephthya gigantea]|uniref:putative sodium-coupled neutral amino acid transporter 7 n=1 Tax=Dendronephthya gigantea TaxID=151771 RepID=UPI00106CC27D|nr:putative sodium-coupled neutral amino acid transporter 7 [Dendronephthya gigantea]